MLPEENKPLTQQELIDAGIDLYPEEMSSDIIYLDNDENEL